MEVQSLIFVQDMLCCVRKSTEDLPRTVAGKIDIRGNNTAAVAAHNLHCNTSTALKAATNIITVPRETERNLRIDA